MNFEEYEDLRNFCKNLDEINLPSSLWGIHIDPEYCYVAVVYVGMKCLTQLTIDKGILLVPDNDMKTIHTSFFIQNELIKIPTLKNSVNTIADLSQLIQIIHDLRLCRNVDNTNCNKYVDFNKYSDICNACTESDLINKSNYTLNKFVNELATENIELTPEPVTNKVCDTCYTTCNHSPETSRFCNVCNKIISQELDQQLIETNEKTNLCSVCGKTFRHSYPLKEHLVTHSSERPFECTVCKKTFAKSYNLRLHQKTHSGIHPYVCSTCGKAYTTQSNLTTHIRSVHTKEKPHACSKCSMTFVHPRHLRLHMVKHTGEKPYSCTICEKTFAKNIHLTIHLRTHTGEKPYLCTSCGKTFTTTGETIDCFKCVSLNNDYKPCEDPFHNNYTLDIYESPCMGGKKGRDGLFPATSCIKIAGTFDDNGDTIVVRGCALDSGTLTTDTEIVRMSHCGGFYYDNRYVRGCVQSCNDADACNSAISIHSYSIIISSFIIALNLNDLAL
ncbi:hypothetical protein FQA39_LY09733 [Lamprigera yunnana]|nr:hypothetical protein FQA39_LY09733 [Lamprigera yunnana]